MLHGGAGDDLRPIDIRLPRPLRLCVALRDVMDCGQVINERRAPSIERRAHQFLVADVSFKDHRPRSHGTATGIENRYVGPISGQRRDKPATDEASTPGY
jgi:hypothetical protein